MNREEIRIAHAIWAHDTFGDIGPVGPLKHLAQEAIEAAENPTDLSEWADIQFLLWDAQRRAGITDEQLTHAMIAKLEQNKKRQWSEVKDGEPVNQVEDGWIDWPGGDCPVADHVMVSVKYRDGRVKEPDRAGGYIWTNGSPISSKSGADIVSYKIADGWINWGGGSRPIPGWQEVDVKFRNGDEAAQFKAENLSWWHTDSNCDIIAYRLVK